MLKVAVCDDNNSIVNEIKKVIESYEKKKVSIKTYNNGEELLDEGEKFDVLFLDIDMPNMDGIEVAKRIRSFDKEVKIIYVTNFTDYKNLAFSVHAFGYLNKPIIKEEIYHQLDEANEYSKQEDPLLEFITANGRERVAVSEIYFFEYLNRKVKMKTLNNTYILKDKITAIGERMQSFGFLMPHKSFTVNLFHVKNIKGYDIYMMDGSIIPLSQKKSAEFREKLTIYLENHI